ncbi:hypothetical protein BYT27DRAFT_6836507 [Phlegmacium glaucopus]|nr:hypothetical protein BYT27DRAFT_6836507 [Phlegmacium glaucopus]
MRSAFPAHVLFPSGPLLPLRWLRLPLLLATLGLSCVCIAVGAQALDRSSKLEMALNAEAQRTRTMIIFDMNDIKNTTIVLTTVASLLALTSLVFSFSLSYDWIRHLLRPKSTRSQEKMDSFDQLPIRRSPFSTRTLGFQALILSFLSVWIFAVLIPSTLFARTRSAHLTIQRLDHHARHLSFNIDTMYWDYGFLRCLAAAPWFSLVFSLPASIVTWVAWKYDASPVGHSI